MKIQEIIDRILAYHPQLPLGQETCDGFKSGNPQAECTGIVTSVQASVDVIRRTAELGANLLIVHEPTFYTHMDATDWLEGDPVYEAKKALLEQTGIAVWRDHDHIHAHRPDGIMTGFAAEMGWQDYLEKDQGFRSAFVLPQTTARQIALELKQKLGLNAVRFIGSGDLPVSRVAMVGHIIGQQEEVTQRIRQENIDVAIALESLDWTTNSYIRDAGQLGMAKALILGGHMNTEELGMKWAVNWIQKLVPELPVQFVASADLYQYV
jgi:putative NIF3 family GTP cyclohydrolase 1 type 2